MTDLNKLADEFQPGVRWAQSRLQEVFNYLDNIPATLRSKQPVPFMQDSKWHLIDTIPDDKMVLAYCDGFYAVIVKTKKQKFAAPWTHWMELPAEPMRAE